MDNPGQRDAVSRFIGILRIATRIVKVVPFLYLLVFALYLIVGSFVPDEALCAIDSVFVVSPAVSGLLLVLSRVFRMCRWHVAACLMPATTNIESFVDSYIVTLTNSEVVAANLFLGCVAIAFLILVNIFVYGRKKVHTRTA